VELARRLARVSEGSIGSLAICDGQNLEQFSARLHRRPQTDDGVLRIRWATAFSTELAVNGAGRKFGRVT
jgi:hypothetical protein